MKKLLDAIDDGLKAKGLSASKASQLAAGNPNVIKNLRMRRGSDRNHPLENLANVAEVLGLELYLGPPRGEQSLNSEGFAERSPEFSAEEIELVEQEQLPDHVSVEFLEEAAARSGHCPVSIERSWLISKGISPVGIKAIPAKRDYEGFGIWRGDIVFVDILNHDLTHPTTFAFFRDLTGGLEIADLTKSPEGEVTYQINPRRGPVSLDLTRAGAKVVGRVAFTLSGDHFSELWDG